MKKNDKKIISIIVPCYNEEKTIPIFYKEIDIVSKDMKKLEFEFIYVDDGSTDKTLEILRDYAKKDKRVRYISFSRNFGKEAAMYAGINNAIGDYVAIMDADMQDPPYMVKVMYENIKDTDYDCIALYTKAHKDYSVIRKSLTSLWYKVLEKITKVNQMPGARDFRLMSRKMVNAIISMREYNRFTKGLYGYVGFNTKWLSYETPNRAAGESKFNIKKLVKYAVEGIVSFSSTPLILSAYVGLIFCFVAFLLIVFIIIKTIIWGDPVGGWPSLACLITFIGGLQLFFFGIMGIYLSKIYSEVKNRPIYIEKENERMMKNEEEK